MAPSSNITASARHVTWALSATSPVHAGGDGPQYQAGRGCPGRDDGVGRITPSNVRKTTGNHQGVIKNGGLNAGFSQILPI
ncbi:hypothetical protein [Methyloglobulus sp.]|uniref:hypothetical protein n=1 Tax=Methyloglobulus sp. TaxID=2518622 RepID=UPI00398A2DF0